MASGLSMPVGFKNSTGGDVEGAVNALESARHPHSFLGITQDGLTAVVHTEGNPDGHVVLRGGRTPNYDRASVEACEKLLRAATLPSRIVVDCSHAQTRKDASRQADVLADLVEQLRAGAPAIMGFMLESNLAAGTQKVTNGRAGLAYGVSITDPCMDWATTERCLLRTAEALGRP
jgi:3-deoxy-7-phosphoheptulonate synthase